MKAIAISHCADIDGVGCVALLRMKYDIPMDKVFLIDYGSEDLMAVERAIKRARPKGTNLFITDLSANDEKVGAFLSIINTIRKGGGKVFWFDHHPWTDRAVKLISGKCATIICGERKECASEITARQLKLGGAFVRRFLKICHYSDFNTKPKDKKAMSLIKTYAIGIASYNTKGKSFSQPKLKALAETLTGGKMTNSDIVAEARGFERISKLRAKEMTKDISLIGSRIAVGFGRSLQSTYACECVMQSSGREVAIFINLDAKKGNIRSKRSNIMPLAVALGGGGHPHASGFSFDKGKYKVATEKGRLLLLDRIDKEAARLGI